MDDLGGFFDFSKPFEREIISGGTLNGRTVKDESLAAKSVKREVVAGTEYVAEFQQAEAKLMETVSDDIPPFNHQ